MSARIGRVSQALKLVLQQESPTGLRDSELLAAFLRRRDESAFTALVERHGGMVLGICQRVLNNHDDAADAMQATFLVLARRASAIRKANSLAAWLHGVAFRVAMQMRKQRDRHRLQQRQAPPALSTPPVDPGWREVLAILDEELQGLPEKHRQPLVLCFLEGLTQEEAAAQLGWPRGTLKRRLERGRELLHARLQRRGLTFGVGGAAVALGSLAAGKALASSVPAANVIALGKSAVPFAVKRAIPSVVVSTTALSLAEGVLRAMFLTKIKVALVAAISVLFLALSTAGAASLWLANTDAGAENPLARSASEDSPLTPDLSPLRGEGSQKDPLPKDTPKDTPPKDPPPKKDPLPKDTPSDAETEFAEFLKDWNEAWGGFDREMRRTRPAEQEKIFDKNPRPLFTARAADLAEKYANDDAAVEPAYWVITQCGANDKAYSRSLPILVKHAASPRVARMVPDLPVQDKDFAAFYNAVIAANPDKKTQARAARRLDGVVPDKLAGQLPELLVGAKIPDVSFTSLDGKKHKFSDFKGKVLLVSVFSIPRHQPEWIYSIWREMWNEDFAGRPVVHVLLNVDGNKEDFEHWLAARPMKSVNAWVGPNSDFCFDWLGEGEHRQRMSTYLVDPKGTIQLHMEGTHDMFGRMEQKVEELLVAAGSLYKPPQRPKVDAKGLAEAAHALAQIRADSEFAHDLLMRLMRLGADDQTRRAALKDFNAHDLRRKAIETAEKHLEDPASFDLLLFAARFTPSGQPLEDWSHIVFLLGKQYAKSDRLIEALLTLRTNEHGAIRFFRKVIEENPDKKIQSRACKYVKEFYERRTDQAEHYLAADGQLREAIRRRSGNKYVDELLDDLNKNKEMREKYIKLYDEKYAKLLPKFEVGKEMPDASFTDLDGKTFKLSDLRGKVVLLELFSATEHHPEMSHQRELMARLKGKPFVAISVSIDDQKETFTRWLKREPGPWINVWCGKHSELYADWTTLFAGITNGSYLIDAKGVLRQHHVGWGDLPDQVDQLFEEMRESQKR